MSILTKTDIKNIFVTNTVPQQVDYSNWIDSCAFINDDNSLDVQSIILPDTAEIDIADLAVGFKSIFINSDNSDILSIKDEAGLISKVSPNHAISFKIDESSSGTHYVLILNSASNVISVNTSAIGVGTYDVDVSRCGISGAVSGAIPIINTLSLNSISGTTFTSASGTLISAQCAQNTMIAIEISNTTGTFSGNVTVEYREI